VPVAVTAKVAVWPDATVLLEGCIVMVGATEEVVTVSIAGVLVKGPAASLRVTVKDAPLSERVVGGVVKVEDVAPLIGMPFLLHW
jgi:hypothetical protein